MSHNFYDFKLITHADSGMDYRKELEIVFVLSGSGVLRLKDSDAHYNFKESDVFVINSFQARDISVKENGLAISLRLDSEFIAESNPDILSPFIECKSFLYNEDEQYHFDKLRKAYAESFRSFYKQESDLSIVMRSKLMNVLSILMTHFMEEKEHKDLKSLERLRDVLYYIHQNYRINISLEELADHVDLSSAYLSRLFKNTVGITVTDYITEIRLNQAIKLLKQDMTITDIAYECGFPSHNAIIAAFNKHKGMTPGKYREHLDIHKNEEIITELDEDGFSTAFNTFLRYVDEEELYQKEAKVSVKEIFINAKERLSKTSESIKNVVNIGYAIRVLDKDIQNQIIKIQKDVGFRYLRVKGILDDDMMVYTKGTDGKEIINFVYIDRILDFILSVDAKPFIEIGHMPKIIAKETLFNIRYGSNLSTPTDVNKWKTLISNLMIHLKERYGEKEISSWLFSPFITPSFIDLGFFSFEEYTQTFITSYQSIRSIVSDAKICGPGTTLGTETLLKKFIEMCQKNDIKIDYYTFKSFGVLDENNESEKLKLNVTPDAFPNAVSQDERYLISMYHHIRLIFDTYNIDDHKIIIEEWSNNIWQRDLANDTIFKSSYVFKHLLESFDLYDGIAYHSLNDQLDEVAPSPYLFSGGFGLFTLDGIPKSVYNAYKLLAKMGSLLLSFGEGYMITQSESKIQIYLYNYTHYDMLYRYRHTTNLDHINRYDIFNDKENISYNFQISGLSNNVYNISTYTISKEEGSGFDAWVQMGAPKTLNEESWDYLLSKTLPKYTTYDTKVSDVLNITTGLKPHEVKLIEITENILKI